MVKATGDNGPKIDATSLTTANGISCGANCYLFGFEINGPAPGSGLLNAGNNGIYVSGTSSVAATAPIYNSGLTVEKVKVTGFRYAGILLQFATKFNQGYADQRRPVRRNFRLLLP